MLPANITPAQAMRYVYRKVPVECYPVVVVVGLACALGMYLVWWCMYFTPSSIILAPHKILHIFHTNIFTSPNECQATNDKRMRIGICYVRFF